MIVGALPPEPAENWKVGLDEVGVNVRVQLPSLIEVIWYSLGSAVSAVKVSVVVRPCSVMASVTTPPETGPLAALPAGKVIT